MGSFAVIYDTNTVISAYGFGGVPEDAIKTGFYDDVAVFVSPPIVDEYERVLGYDRLPFTKDDQNTITPEFRMLTNARLERQTPDLEIVDDDPDDDKFLELAAASGADYLVSGDDHLLAVNTFHGTKILNPREFLDEVDKTTPQSPLRW